MSNGDRSYKHAVVLRYGSHNLLCCTDSGEPAVYEDSAPAELLASQLRDRHPDQHYSVLSFQVL